MSDERPEGLSELSAANAAKVLTDLGLGEGATIASVQRHLNVGAANAMRLLSLREHIRAQREQSTALARLREERERLEVLVASWRRDADAHDSHAHCRSDPYDDVGHEHRLKASAKRRCADVLEAALSSPSASENTVL